MNNTVISPASKVLVAGCETFLKTMSGVPSTRFNSAEFLGALKTRYSKMLGAVSLTDEERETAENFFGFLDGVEDNKKTVCEKFVSKISCVLKKLPEEDRQIFTASPLKYSLANRSAELGVDGVLEILVSGNTPFPWDLPDEEGRCAIHKACDVKIPDEDAGVIDALDPFPGKCLGILLDAGENVNRRTADENGFAPVHIASRKTNPYFLVKLLDRGGLPNLEDKNGRTPLRIACAYGVSRSAEILIDRGSTPEAVDGVYYLKTSSDDEEIMTRVIEKILRAGNLSPNTPEPKDGFAPLHIAAGRGLSEVASKLFELGAEPNIQDNEGNTLFHIMVSDRNLKSLSDFRKIADKARELGGNAHIQNNNGATPLAVTAASPVGWRVIGEFIEFLEEKSAPADLMSDLTHVCEELSNLWGEKAYFFGMKINAPEIKANILEFLRAKLQSLESPLVKFTAEDGEIDMNEDLYC